MHATLGFDAVFFQCCVKLFKSCMHFSKVACNFSKRHHWLPLGDLIYFCTMTFSDKMQGLLSNGVYQLLVVHSSYLTRMYYAIAIINLICFLVSVCVVSLTCMWIRIPGFLHNCVVDQDEQ